LEPPTSREKGAEGLRGLRALREKQEGGEIDRLILFV